MKTQNVFTAFTFLVCLGTIVSSCKKEDAITSKEGQAEKGYATGKAINAKGTPITGAEILLDNTILYASYIHGTTGTDGTYKIKMAEGVWKASATIEQLYNDRTYTLKLAPDNTESFDGNGGVRNFTWKLTGGIPGESGTFYGGTIAVDAGVGTTIPGRENIRIKLSPVGSLIDGTTGENLSIAFGDAHWQDYYLIKDIPIGRYKIQAFYRNNGSDVPLLLHNRSVNGTDYEREPLIDFMPVDRFNGDNAVTIEYHE